MTALRRGNSASLRFALLRMFIATMLVVAALAVVVDARIVVKYQGTALQGISAENIHRGGNTILIQLANGGTFAAALDSAAIAARLADSIRTASSPSSVIGWNDCVGSVIGNATLLFTNQRKNLRITLAPCQRYNARSVERVSIMVPVEIIDALGSGSVGSKAPLTPAPTRTTAPASFFEGPSFFVLPARLSFTVVDAVAQAPGSGVPVTLRLSDAGLLTAGKYRIVEGTMSCPTSGASIEALSLSPANNTLTFTPLKGGAMSLCYVPKAAATVTNTTTTTNATVPNSTMTGGQVAASADNAHPSEMYIRADGTIVVIGPEGFTADPMEPRAGIEFTATVWGTQLSDEDAMTFIDSEASCVALMDVSPDLTVSLVLPGGGASSDGTTSSSSRGQAFPTIHQPGKYTVCFKRSGMAQWLEIGEITIRHGGDSVIERDVSEAHVSRDTVVLSSVHIGHLTVSSARIVLEAHQLNVSRFLWLGGAVVGPGTLNSMGAKSRIAVPEGPVEIDFVIKNFGHMEINVSSFHLSGNGVIQNWGTLVLFVNSTPGVDAAMEHANGGRFAIINNAGKYLKVACSTGSACHLRVSGLDNRGRIDIEPECDVKIRRFDSIATGASVNVKSGASFSVTYGSMRTLLLTASPGAKLNFNEGNVELHGAVFRGDGGGIGFLNGHIYLHDTTFEGNLSVIFQGQGVLPAVGVAATSDSSDVNNNKMDDGNTRPSQALLVLEGHTRFSVGVMVAMRQVNISAAHTSISFFTVSGRLLCHAPSTVFGDNVVVKVQLETVFFGAGEQGAMAKLVPQNVPQNSSFVVPQNSTFIVLDVGNYSRAAGPRVCTHYLVVPMHVRFEGRIVLLGCALLPFGGVHSGVVVGFPDDQTATSQVESAVQFAFCRNVLAFRDACLPLFDDDNPAPPLQGATATVPVPVQQSASLRGHASVSGLLLRGDHLLKFRKLSAIGDASMPRPFFGGGRAEPLSANQFVSDEDIVVSNGAASSGVGAGLISRDDIDVDSIIIDEGARVSTDGTVSISARHNLWVRINAQLSLTGGGGRIRTHLLTLDGLVSIDANKPLMLDGNGAVSNTGKLRVTVRETGPQTCAFPLTISSLMEFARSSQLQCSAAVDAPDGSSFPLIQAGGFVGPTNVDMSTCSPRGGSAVQIAREGSSGSSGSAIGFRVEPSASSPPRVVQTVGLVAIVVIAAVYLRLFFWRMTIVDVVVEWRKRTDYPLVLSWPEFSSFASNFVAIGAVAADHLFLCMPAFHHSVPLPTSASFITPFATSLMTIHLVPESAPQAFLLILFTLILFWGITWIPIVGKKYSDQTIRSLLHHREKATHRQAIRFLFQFHTLASFVSLVCFLPAVSVMMDAMSCVTIFAKQASCKPLRGYGFAAFPFALLFFYLAPYSGQCASFPFAHPPYMRELDVRYKRVYIYCKYTLYLVQIACWKLFAHNVAMLLVTSIVVQCALTAATVSCRPTVYRNINTLLNGVGAVPIWCLLCALMQVVRFGPHRKFVCQDIDGAYPGVLITGILGVVAATVVFTRWHSVSDSAKQLSLDATAAIHVRALVENDERIEELRLEMYNTGSARERERVADSIAAMRIHHLQLLNAYRRLKERVVLPYLLGDRFGGSLLNAQVTTFDFDDTVGTASFGDEAGGAGIPMRVMTDAERVAMGAAGVTPASPGTPRGALVRNKSLVGAGASGGVPATPRTPVTNEDDLTAEQMEAFIKGPPLGHGSYGVVYMGMLGNGKLVAVKEVEISRKHKKESLASLKREVNMLKTLVHPNVVRYYGCHAAGRMMRVFMEFAVGGSLTSVVRKFEKLSEPVARMYIHQVLLGLQFLHARHVVHRDIKGENILIDGHGVAKLADFGASKTMADMANKSREGCESLVGSPYWMAPEVIRNESYGTKADVWSVGCTVVEVLNGGNPPWDEKFDNIYSAMYFIGNTTGIPSNIPSDVSTVCRDFLGRCFERDVARRACVSELLAHPWISGAAVPAALGGNASGNANAESTVSSSLSSTDRKPGGAAESSAAAAGTGNGDEGRPVRQWSDMFESSSDGTATIGRQHDISSMCSTSDFGSHRSHERRSMAAAASAAAAAAFVAVAGASRRRETATGYATCSASGGISGNTSGTAGRSDSDVGTPPAAEDGSGSAPSKEEDDADNDN